MIEKKQYLHNSKEFCHLCKKRIKIKDKVYVLSEAVKGTGYYYYEHPDNIDVDNVTMKSYKLVRFHKKCFEVISGKTLIFEE